MTSRVSWRSRSAVAGGALVLLLAACGSGSDDPEAGGSGGSEGGSPSPASPSSVRVPTTPPAIEPADGPLIRTEGATIRGLKTYKLVSDFGVLQGYRDDQSTLSFLPGYTDKPSLDAFAKQYERIAEEDDGDVLERVDDVVVGGEYNAFHMLDTEDPIEEGHVFGVMFLNGSWTIHINFYEQGEPRPLTAEERQEVIDSILASFEPTFN